VVPSRLLLHLSVPPAPWAAGVTTAEASDRLNSGTFRTPARHGENGRPVLTPREVAWSRGLL
jgi:hypothetical protein